MSSRHDYKPHSFFEGPAEKQALGGVVYGLLKDILIAMKIAQAAKQTHKGNHNFDKAETLLEHAKAHKPVLLILDWDTCEAEAFKVLKEMNQNADLKGVANVGFLSGSKETLREEARRAGCHRVYQKTEFMRELPMIVARCAP